MQNKLTLKLALAILCAILFVSCKQGFKKVSVATTKILSLDGSNKIKIKEYTLNYNAEDDGYIHLTLDGGGKYEAKGVNGGSCGTILGLLKEPNVLFDTLRLEVTLNKVITP